MDTIKKAAQVVKQGGVIIFPTDTAFGIGCRIDNEKAVKRLFNLRKRPETKATPVLVSDREMAQAYLEPIPEVVKKKLIERYWPGALTIVLPCKEEKIPVLVRGNGNTLGMRMPNHQVILEIIKQVGVPVLGPSANFSGETTPYDIKDIDADLIKLVDYVVPGECTMKRASTVVDCTNIPWKVLREGAVKVNF